ncbi:MAG: NAD-dependent epimerase/dehydratase family protein [Chloroflexi bacterium]|nr:MAG: NAD-dependent epimerase/dehydratase family protein [Chloroflexota bacterium]
MSYLNGALKGALQNKNVLVTGATGFVGGRLAQRLATEEGAIVTGTGRNLDKAAFVKEAGVNLVHADLSDYEKMETVVNNQEIIFHVAAWLGRHGLGDERAYKLNVTATESLVKQAAAAGVRRLVLVSSIAAYEFPKTQRIYEDTPLDPEQMIIYGRTKAIGEYRATALANELGLELTIVRPALVYGPRADSWTINIVKLIKKGVPVVFGNGSGTIYPVYVDNLVDGMLLTAVHPAAVGEAFNFSDPVLSMREFFDYYGNMCGRKPRRLPFWVANIMVTLNKWFNLKLPIDPDRLKRLALKIEYPTTKAEELLAYKMRVPVPQGMQQTECWLREVGMIE